MAIHINGCAQNSGILQHADQISSSDNATILTGAKGLYANPAALFIQDVEWQFDLSAFKRYNTDIHSLSGSFSRKWNKSAFGAAVGTYGIDGFNENEFSVGFARQIGKLSAIGIQAHYYTLKIEQLGSRNKADISVGAWHETENGIIFSLYVLNPLSATNDNLDQFGKIDLGLGYKLSRQLQLFTTLGKLWGEAIAIRPGFKYKPYDYLELMASISTDPSSMSFGLNVLMNDAMTTHFAYNTHPFLGNSLAFSFGYALQTK